MLVGVFLVVGCGREYGHQQLAGDSPEAREVERLVEELRQAAPERRGELMRSQAADGLEENRFAALAAALRELADAEIVTVKRVDRYGEDVFQASFEWTTAEGKRRASLLLVRADGRLRWAGPN